MITFDFVSFYTEIPISFINEKLNFLKQLFINKAYEKSSHKYKFYGELISLIQDGYKIASKYCIIKINDEYYIQKEGVIMGASFAPNLANLSVLTHLIQEQIYKCIQIKLNMRSTDDTLMIYKQDNNININRIFAKFYPKVLDYTSTSMKDNRLKFLDILFIKINKTFQYVIQFKLKLEFFIPFHSNHPKHIKINIVRNMANRAAVLCSNRVLYNHAIIALKIRFKLSGFPELFLNEHIDNNLYFHRNNIINKLNIKRSNKINMILNQCTLFYKPLWIPDDEKHFIFTPYDKLINDMKRQKYIKIFLKQKYPNKHIVYKLNDSIQKVIRCKNANYLIFKYL